MRCMCGDPYCGSCGPAQGNYKCLHCGAWSEDGGCKDPAKCELADKKFAEEWAADIQWERDNAEAIEAAIRRTD